MRPRSRAAPLAAVTIAIVLASACAKIAGIDGLTVGQCKGGGACLDGASADGEPGDDTTDDGGGDGGDLDAAYPPCPTDTKGATLMHAGDPSNAFCIDSTEVSVGDYKTFLADAPDADVSSGNADCAWKTSHAPAFSGPDDVPQTGVDWCDAYSYCKWAGKRLCGKIDNGAAAGALTSDDLGNYNTHEWLIACSAQGQLIYPYGSIRQVGVCNLLDSDAGKTEGVSRTMNGCEGGYKGIFDMVGNVWEWIDLCRPLDAGADAGDGGPQKMECIVKGGSFASSPPTALNCRVDGVGGTRDVRANDVGFRCCAP